MVVVKKKEGQKGGEVEKSIEGEKHAKTKENRDHEKREENQGNPEDKLYVFII